MDSENKIRFYTLQCDLREQLRKVDSPKYGFCKEKAREKAGRFGFSDIFGDERETQGIWGETRRGDLQEAEVSGIITGKRVLMVILTE